MDSNNSFENKVKHKTVVNDLHLQEDILEGVIDQASSRWKTFLRYLDH